VNTADRKDEQTAVKAADVRSRAAAWLIKRRDHEDWSENDQIQLDSWLAESPSHKIAYLRVDAAWQRADRLSALRRPPSGSGRVSSVLKFVAAGIAVAAVLGAVVVTKLDTSSTTAYVTGVGGHETLTLGDGSQIELNTDTSLRVTNEAARRTVWLDKGEAYFQIAHNTVRPFVVIAGDHRITDLGTQFLVRRDENSLRVALLQGRAQFDGENTHGKQQAVLSPGDVVIATANSLSISQQPMQDLKAALGWRHGLIVFHHATLVDAANEYNRYNLRKIVIADPSIAQLNINGSLPANDVSAFARSVRTFFNLHVEEHQDEVVISR
jgi:transmembrane sensor